MELRFSPLFSGSSGNATYVGCGDAHILVDAGVSGKRVLNELKTVGVDPTRLDGILVTHDHADHIHGIGVLSRKLDVPIYASTAAWEAILPKIGRVHEKNIRCIEPGRDFFIGPIDVTPFATPHDAPGSVGYAFEAAGARFAIATDLGCVRDMWLKHVTGADAVLLESNYDPDMLYSGPYPYDLKRRISGNRGHLSNEDAGEVAVELVKSGTKQLILGHLSKENNFPELAYRSTDTALRMAGFIPGEDVELSVAERDQNSGMFGVRVQL